MKNKIQALGTLLASPAGLFIHLLLLVTTFGIYIYQNSIVYKSTTTTLEGLITEAEFLKMDPELTSKPLVEVGLTLNSFNTFDIEKNDFAAVGVIWFIYNPEEISIEKLSEFSFTRGELKSKIGPSTHPYKDNRVISRFSIFVKFTAHLKYLDFPLDDHNVKLILKNDNLTSKNVHFVSSKKNLNIEKNAFEFAAWKLQDFDAQVGYDETSLREDNIVENIYYPHTVFAFSFNRVGIHFILLVLIPLIFIFFVCLSVFLLRPAESLEAFETMLFSLIGFLFILESISPKVGHLTLADDIYFTTFVASLMVLTLGWFENAIPQWLRGIIGTIVEIAMIIMIFLISHYS